MNKGLIKTIEINTDKANAKWDYINLIREKSCSRCKNTLSLTNFCEIEKSKYSQKRYNSFCKACDNIRTCKYKNTKISTIEGKATELLSNAKRRAKDKDLDLQIDIDYIVYLWNKQDKKCYYTGEDMTLGSHQLKKDKNRDNFKHVSLDRVDSNLGYTKDNTVLCCWGINNMKQQLALDQFIYWCQKLIDNQPLITTNK